MNNAAQTIPHDETHLESMKDQAFKSAHAIFADIYIPDLAKARPDLAPTAMCEGADWNHLSDIAEEFTGERYSDEYHTVLNELVDSFIEGAQSAIDEID